MSKPYSLASACTWARVSCRLESIIMNCTPCAAYLACSAFSAAALLRTMGQPAPKVTSTTALASA